MMANKKLPIQRLVKFGLVGGMATGVHLAVLLLLVRLAGLATGPSNLAAFVTAFLLSTTLQQQFTFADRMAGQSLKKRSVLLLFCVNATAAYGLGAVAKGLWLPVLALVPPVLNYTLLHLFSGHPRFKR
jgi:putative flippase GtrA